MSTATKRIRENRTITVDFRDEATYFQLLCDGKAFVEFVFAFLLALGFQLLHTATCDGGGGSVAKLAFGGKTRKSALGKSTTCESQLSCFR